MKEQENHITYTKKENKKIIISNITNSNYKTEKIKEENYQAQKNAYENHKKEIKISEMYLNIFKNKKKN